MYLLFYAPPIVSGGSVLVFVLVCISLTFLVCNHLDEDEKAGSFAFIAFCVSCYCKCLVALPHGAMGWSVVYDCGIF